MRAPPEKNNPRPSSWEPVNQWYRKIVGDEGHYYHKHVVLPGVLRWIQLAKSPTNPIANISLVDFGCGQGILATHLPKGMRYLGIDSSPSLIKEAKQRDKLEGHTYAVGDVTQQLPLPTEKFSHAALILSLQNMANPEAVFTNCARYLRTRGELIIVLNHPCFRIPRQSAWGVDDSKKLQYRRLDRYMTPMEIPIAAHPSQAANSAQTLSFHFPLSFYIQALAKKGFSLIGMEEWVSPKESEGKNSKMENRSREEFPLFLTLVARYEGETT